MSFFPRDLCGGLCGWYGVTGVFVLLNISRPWNLSLFSLSFDFTFWSYFSILAFSFSLMAFSCFRSYFRSLCLDEVGVEEEEDEEEVEDVEEVEDE